MNNFKEKIKNIQIPFNHSALAFAFSIFALAFAVGSFDSPCINASTCAVGSDNEFSGNISLKGGTANSGTFDASGMTADRTWTLPDASGTLALEGATLSASKVMATDVSGNETTTDVYPLSLTINSALKTDGSGNVTASNLDPETDLTIGTGTANQVLGVNSGGTALTFTSITGVPTLTGNQAVVTDGAGALTVANLTADKFVISDSNGSLTTTDIIPLSFGANKPIVSDGSGNLTDVTLTADTPMKTDANGNTSASDLDITTDITPGAALTQIRTNAAGNALEYFTPSSSGGRWSLVGQGQMSQSSYTMGACWYDDTQGTGIGGGLDQTKVYKFVVEPTGSMSSMGNNGSYPAMVVMNETNCSNIASSGNYLYSSSVTNNGFWSINTQGWQASFNSYVNAPWLGYQQHTTSNSSSSKCGGASIEMIIRNGVDLNGASANTKNEGVKITDMRVSAPCYNTSGVLTGWQQSDNSGMTWDSTQSYGASPADNMNQMTGIQFKRYDGGGTFSQPVWYLYESDY